MASVKALSSLGFRRLVNVHFHKLLSASIRCNSSGPRVPPGYTDFADGMRRAEQFMRDFANSFGFGWPFRGGSSSGWWTNAAGGSPGSHWSYEDTYVEENGQRKWRLTMDMSFFKPKDIDVSTRGRQLIIKAKHSSVDHRQDAVKYEFEREYTLPDGVLDVKTVTSKYTNDGRLVIEAVYVEVKTPGRGGEGEQDIPVKHT